MDISKLAIPEAIEAVTAMETVSQLREAATSIGLKFSGNTGEGTLRTKLMDVLNNTPPVPETEVPETNPVPEFEATEVDTSSLLRQEGDDEEVIQKAVIIKKPAAPTIKDLLEMDPNQIEEPQLLRQVVRARALRLIRVRITNLDPGDAQLPGSIITALNKYTGKISRFISFGDENDAGTHVEQILLNHLKQQKFALRKEKKGGQFGVKQYDTRMIPKYNIEYLKPLTQAEIDELSAQQRAAHAIDK